ncbi:hypothetical protein H4S07_001532 [Coemansia furcata]|uniref:Uncharacterized protein n=1 Tax=Coemansia furcata TaxID=417177 RepID=A0ACC1LMZ6_9FUNG|nr:hypothetical protein H4S07_001532 [Coemansia furcata]
MRCSFHPCWLALVELALNPVSVKDIWDPYVADGWQDSSSGRLVFPRLQSLSLGFFDNDFVMVSFDPRPENEETGEETFLDDFKRCFMRSAKFGTLVFPVLTSLEIRHFHQGLTEFLSVFAASPISNFVLTVPNETIPFNWDLSSLTGLCSFAIRIMRPNELNDMVAIFYCLWLMFRSVSPQLRELTVELYICRGYKFGLFKAGTFGENLVSLTLKCEIEPEQLHVVLGAYPNLKRLHLHWIIAYPIAPTSELASRLRAMGAATMQTPICRHLQFLRAEGLKHYKYLTIPTSASIAPTTVTTEVALYRGLLLNLVCHLPSLVTFKVSATAFDGISKCINMLTTAGNGPEHLRQLKLQAIDD